MGFLSQKWKNNEAWKNWRNKYKIVIRCPRCNARHYPNRADNKNMEETGQYCVYCGCGHKYFVVDGATNLYIKEYRNGQ